MKLFKKILKYLAYSMLSILVVFSLYTVIVTKVMHKKYVNVFGYTYFVVASGSMSGTIEINDIIIVKINDSYKQNDIITFYDNGAFITHRVVKIEGERVITRGDVNNTEDEPVLAEDIIGRVVFVISFSMLLKILALLVFLFIIYIITNFEEIFSKYIMNDNRRGRGKSSKTPLEYTQIIKVNKNSNIPMVYQKEDDIEVLELDDEKEFIELVLKIFKLKKKKLKLTKEGSLKLKYVYELAVTDLYNSDDVEKCIINIPFDELYNYEFDDIDFTKNIQDKLYEMPIYIYLKLMAYALLYDENEYFDAIFKILKYRIKIDHDNKFIKNNRRVDEVLTLIEKIIVNVGYEENFDLQHIKDKVLIDKEVRNIEIIGDVRICKYCGRRILNYNLDKCPNCSKSLK